MAHADTAESMRRAVRGALRRAHDRARQADQGTAAALIAECGVYVVPTLVAYAASQIVGGRVEYNELH